MGVGLAIFYFSCNKDDPSHPIPQEELLIEQIVATSSIEAIGVMDLPSAISDFVNEGHAPFEIELAFHAAPHGFEVFLENGVCLYFDQHGNHLNHDGMHGDVGNYHGGSGLGFSFCLAGDTLNIADMPQAALDYISANYSGANIVTVVVKPSGKLAIEISNGDILMFSPAGNFIHLCDIQETGVHGHGHGNMGNPGWHCDPEGGMMGGHMGQMGHEHGNHGGMGGHHNEMGNLPGMNEHCWGGTGISIDNLPAPITTYVNDNHPETTIFHALQTYSHNYFLRLSDCARIVFDEKGNMLFDSGD